ncbi:hypothetical protein I4U23_023290 [Adineta vaga]|nr:hypothetical protein I4U23_023290 [Adineta vaga]
MTNFNLIGCVVIILLVGICTSSSPNIPGLGHLKSGFDALKMKSIDDMETVDKGDKTKAAIFNSDEIGMLYELKTDGKIQVFQTPAVVQVTDVSLRTENYCETVVSTFEEFYKNYIQLNITLIIVGISVGIIKASIGYNKMLENAFNATKDGKQAVAISGKWWGMYSMQLPPAFILPYDRNFNLSIQRLQQIGTRTTEYGQSIYNQVTNAYGTHYVTSVIVGGKAGMYSFINTTYTNSHSYEKISEQVSFNFQYKMATLSGNINSGSYAEKLSEDFVKNSNAITEFHPPVQTEAGELEWNVWLDKTWQQPVAINRTVSPITELVAEYPAVQTHLQKTIDYYLKSGTYPSLQQLQ